MATDCIPQVTFEFQGLSQPVVARVRPGPRQFGWRGGAAQGLDDAAGADPAAGGLPDGPAAAGQGRSTQLLELVRQRVFGLACGYADCNDAARLADDPIHKLLLDRDPLAGPALASQPTLSRFENAVGRRELLDLAQRRWPTR